MSLILIPNLQFLSPHFIVFKYFFIAFFLVTISKNRFCDHKIIFLFCLFAFLFVIDALLVFLDILYIESLISISVHWLLFIISVCAGRAYNVNKDFVFKIFFLHFIVVILQYISSDASTFFNMAYGTLQDEYSQAPYRRHAGLSSSFYANILFALFLLCISTRSIKSINSQFISLALIFMSLSRTSIILLIATMRFTVVRILIVILVALIAYQFSTPLRVLMYKAYLIMGNIDLLISEKYPSVSQRVDDYRDFLVWITQNINDRNERLFLEKNMEIGWLNSILNGYTLGIALYLVCFISLLSTFPLLALSLGFFELVSIGLWRYDILFLSGFLIGQGQKCK